MTPGIPSPLPLGNHFHILTDHLLGMELKYYFPIKYRACCFYRLWNEEYNSIAELKKGYLNHKKKKNSS